ncbi:uncharacterized protein METZ01_LOCUS260006, partial [marine metagenome]
QLGSKFHGFAISFPNTNCQSKELKQRIDYVVETDQGPSDDIRQEIEQVCKNFDIYLLLSS